MTAPGVVSPGDVLIVRGIGPGMVTAVEGDSVYVRSPKPASALVRLPAAAIGFMLGSGGATIVYRRDHIPPIAGHVGGMS